MKRKNKKVRVVKPAKVKKVKPKRNSTYALNQFEDMKKWLAYYEENKKLPHGKIICSHCKINFISLKGLGMFHAMKAFDKDMKRILNESICKSCKDIIDPPEVKEKKERVVDVLTREEMQARRDKISASLPKIDFYKERAIFDISKNKDKCKEYTYFACHRPDIYLDYGCEECSLKKYCVCPIKDVNRVADGKHKIKKKK